MALVSMLVLLTGTRCEEGLSMALQEEPEELSKAEVNSLIRLREEEMLAHDVYLALSEVYSLPVFRNISRSETAHTGAIKTLIDRYGVEDPAAGHKQGKFTDPQFQALYEELVERGSLSLAEAIKVGLLIEDMDIADLEEALETVIAREDIRVVYENLMDASARHMKVFYFHAGARGIEYAPAFISRERFEEITGADIQ